MDDQIVPGRRVRYSPWGRLGNITDTDNSMHNKDSIFPSLRKGRYQNPNEINEGWMTKLDRKMMRRDVLNEALKEMYSTPPPNRKTFDNYESKYYARYLNDYDNIPANVFQQKMSNIVPKNYAEMEAEPKVSAGNPWSILLGNMLIPTEIGPEDANLTDAEKIKAGLDPWWNARNQKK